MAENPELEALIVEHPDDVDGYLVYGDWLEAQGDPRGTLVALQAAGRPIAEIDQYVASHRRELLGPLAGHPPSQVGIHWRLGFFDGVRLHVSDDETLGVLEALLGHASSRFLRRLEIVPGVHASSADCVTLILARGPATLRELEIGSWSISAEPRAAELRSRFPRLERPLDVVWQEILAAVGKTRRASTRYQAEALPPLEARPGVKLAAPIAAATVMTALRHEIDKDKPLGIMGALRRTFTDESLDDFMVAIGEQFASFGEPTNHRWGFLAMGALGGDRAAAWIGDRMEGWSHQRATQGSELLGRIGTGLAIYELFGVATDTRMRRAHRRAASEGLAKAAGERGVALDELLDRSAPTHPPGAAALERMQAAVMRRLAKQMVGGRRVTTHGFRHYFADHPVVGPLASRVVWGVWGRDDRLVSTFRIVLAGENTARATFVDATDTAVAIDGGSIGVLHPAELPEKTRKKSIAAWKSALEAARITPLFEQLDRPVHELREQEGGTNLGRFKLRHVDYGRLQEVLVIGRDWRPFGGQSRWDNDDDDTVAHGPNAWGKSFDRDDVWVIASLDEARRAMVAVTASKQRGEDDDAGDEVRFDELHAVTVSEILYDLETAIPHDDERARAAKPSREEVAALEEKIGVKKGSRVRLGLRANEGKGKWGVVFWVGEKDGRGRCGIRTDDDETIWADVAVLERSSAEEIAASLEAKAKKERRAAAAAPAPAAAEAPRGELAKGDRVRWKNGNVGGTGKVFWLGPGKFGGGPRAGVKDDDTGETIWTEQASCERLD